MKKTYCMLGVAGFVAPRHLKAIKETGGELIASCDPFDSVGILDSYFPQSEFFTSESDFRYFCKQNSPDYMVICTPNYLHKSQSQFGMSIGADIICEKPAALYPSDLEHLVNTELITGKQVYTILQLRLKPELQGLRCELERINEYQEVAIDYITPRGKWYSKSWKADEEKSGSLATNIGIHLFDLMLWLFGSVEEIKLSKKTDTEVIGELYLTRAHIAFNLSISGVKSKRSIVIGKREIEFSKGFTELHTSSYKAVLSGNGFGLAEAAPSIVLCDKIRKIQVT